MKPIVTPFSKALHRLMKYFMVQADVFEGLSREEVVQWALETLQPGYRFTHWQHTWLTGSSNVGHGRPERMGERLSAASLVALELFCWPGEGGIRGMCERAGVRV